MRMVDDEYKAILTKRYIQYVDSISFDDELTVYESFDFSFRKCETKKFMKQFYRNPYTYIHDEPVKTLVLYMPIGDRLVILPTRDQIEFLSEYGCTITRFREDGEGYYFLTNGSLSEIKTKKVRGFNFRIWRAPYELRGKVTGVAEAKFLIVGYLD